MDKETFNELADKLAINPKSEEEISEMAWMIIKVAIERALEIEMEEHLGEKSKGRRNDGNSRNGYSPKNLKTDTAEIPLEIPRDQNADFEPQLINKYQHRSGDLDNKILSLYAKGMVRDT